MGEDGLGVVEEADGAHRSEPGLYQRDARGATSQVDDDRIVNPPDRIRLIEHAFGEPDSAVDVSANQLVELVTGQL